jgi:hypothetical protein
MRGKAFTTFAAVTLGLSGCGIQQGGPEQGGGRGAYTGVGLYSPTQPWTKLIANQQAKDPEAARAIDDQVIIVVQNSATGEIRACGDLTGYCIGMNPWKAPLLASQVAPVRLTEHRAPDEPDAMVEIGRKSRLADKPRDKDGQGGRS